jgi:hypothetical protein
MIKYVINSDISTRINLNPFQWLWMPAVSHEGPTEVFPTRHTFMIAWLFIQIFFDVHDGMMDFTKLGQTFEALEDIIEVDEDDKPKLGL